MAEISQKSRRRAKKQVKKALRRLHPATIVIALLCLVVGVGCGGFLAKNASKNDCFHLKGNAMIALEVGERYTYVEQGVEAVSYGRDVSDKVQVQTTLEKDAQGNYIIPTDKEGIYTITYTVDCLKFGRFSPDGALRRIRSFVVSAPTGGEEE